MAEREGPETTPEAREWERRGRTGGGPGVPEGDTEPSNWPGETRARGMRPPEPEPVVPDEADQEP